MKCTRAHRALHRAIDGELPARHMAALRHHVESCGPCARLERDLRALRKATSALAAAPALPVTLLPSVDLRSRGRRPWFMAGGLAAAVVCSAVVWKLLVGGLGGLHSPTASPTGAIPQGAQPFEDPAATTQVQPPVQVRFSPGSKVVAVEKPSRSPNITILWVYPALTAADTTTSHPSPSSSKGVDL